MTKRSWWVFLALGACVAAFAGSASSVRADSKAQPVHIAWFNIAAANAFTAAMTSAIRHQAKAMNASVTMFDAGFDQTKQVTQMQDAIASKKYNAFIVLPVNGAVLVHPTEQAIKAGIKVVASYNGIGPDIDSIKPQVPGMTAVVGERLSTQGTYTGQAIVKACGNLNPCTVAYMPGSFKQATELSRLQAVTNLFKKHPNIKMIKAPEGQFLAAPALKGATDVLLAHPNINVFASTADQMTVGIIHALKNAKLSGKVKIVSDGGTVEAMGWVKTGTIATDVVNLPATDGRVSAKFVISAVRGKKVPSSVNDFTLSPVGPFATKATLSTPAGRKFKGEWHA